ncbi:hypothetical protein [Sphingomonas sp. MMS24-J13]|uniref:hypothetical protein n=1 Tax=Sphingomonas sp. MMS24-J13 TaxID=3238686 RepID=UPI00384C4372
MGKIVKIVAVVAIAVVIAVYAPQLSAALVQAGWSTAAATAAVAVATAAVTIGAQLALNAIFPPPSAGRGGAQAAMSVFRQSISNSFLIYGRRRVGGLMIFYHPKGANFRYYVIAAAGHRCKGAVGWYLNDETVTVDDDGKVTSGTYANHAWLWFARGTEDQVANPTFVDECDGQWTEDHRGRGIALIYAKFQMVDAVVQAGMPVINAVVEGKDDIRDPRTGGVGYMRLATPIIYDWMALPREEGGFGAEADEIPEDDLLAAWTNVCDEDVTIADGVTEKRYELDCWITTGAAPSEIRKTLVDSVAGSYTYSDGRFLIRPGYWVGPSHSLSEHDLSAPIKVSALGDPQAIVTELSGTFIDPTNNYQPMPVPTRSVPTDDIRQGDADLAHITSSTRGERILEIMLRRAQCEKRVSWPMNIAGIAVEALETVQLDTTRYGLSNYAFVVDQWGLSSDFSVQLQLREENEDIYSDAITYRSGNIAPALATADPIVPTNGLSSAIVPGAATVACDPDGTPKAGQLPLTAQILLYDGATDVHTSATYTIDAGSTGGDWSVNGTGLVTFDEMTADIASATIKATLGTREIKQGFSVKKVRDGSAGSSGATPYLAVPISMGTTPYPGGVVLDPGQTVTLHAEAVIYAGGGSPTCTITAQCAVDNGSFSDMGGDYTTTATVAHLDTDTLLIDGAYTNTSGAQQFVTFQTILTNSTGTPSVQGGSYMQPRIS